MAETFQTLESATLLCSRSIYELIRINQSLKLSCESENANPRAGFETFYCQCQSDRLQFSRKAKGQPKEGLETLNIARGCMTQMHISPTKPSLFARVGAAIATGVVTITAAGVIQNAAPLVAQATSAHDQDSSQALLVVARAVSNQDPPRRGDERRG